MFFNNHSIVTPLFKSGDHRDLNNYRPVSKISNVSKIFEKAILNQILNFFDKNNLFFPYQFGFRKGHNTLNLIQVFLNDVHNKIDNKKQCCAVFIDFSKAFDSINHIILLNKVKFQYNFSNKTISLIRSYLSYRSQKVQINKVLSDCLDIKAGVPQGSLLGPISF